MLKKIIIIIGALGVAIGLTLTNQAPEAVYKLFPGYFPDSDKAWEDSPCLLYTSPSPRDS